MRLYLALLFFFLPACRGCSVRDRYELIVNEEVHKRVEAIEKEQRASQKTPGQVARETKEWERQQQENREPRFIDRTDYRALNDACDPTNEDLPRVQAIISRVGPRGIHYIIPPEMVAQLVIPPGAVDHLVEITIVTYDSLEPDHHLDYAVLPLGIELNKPGKLIVPIGKDGPALHRFMPVGHGEYQDMPSLYEPDQHTEVITLNRI